MYLFRNKGDFGNKFSITEKGVLKEFWRSANTLMPRLLAGFRNGNLESESFPRLLAKIRSRIIFIFVDPTAIWESNTGV